MLYNYVRVSMDESCLVRALETVLILAKVFLDGHGVFTDDHLQILGDGIVFSSLNHLEREHESTYFSLRGQLTVHLVSHGHRVVADEFAEAFLSFVHIHVLVFGVHVQSGAGHFGETLPVDLVLVGKVEGLAGAFGVHLLLFADLTEGARDIHAGDGTEFAVAEGKAPGFLFLHFFDEVVKAFEAHLAAEDAAGFRETLHHAFLQFRQHLRGFLGSLLGHHEGLHDNVLAALLLVAFQGAFDRFASHRITGREHNHPLGLVFLHSFLHLLSLTLVVLAEIDRDDFTRLRVLEVVHVLFEGFVDDNEDLFETLVLVIVVTHSTGEVVTHTTVAENEHDLVLGSVGRHFSN